jgi:GMP synthase-like glutamine amidotransferase
VRVQVFQHVPFEDLGSIRPWLVARGADVHYTRFFAHDPLPSVDDFDALIVLGGPMSVNDEALHPWLTQEKQLLRDAIAHDRPILGICLGAQLIASALGARVYPNAVKEIGWFPLRGVPISPSSSAAASQPKFQFPAESIVFHWHGDTFDLPEGAIRLASTAVCQNQAFQLTRNVLGLQFHLETTPESAKLMIEHGADELVTAPYIQTAAQMLDAPASRYEAINQLMENVLAAVFAPVLASIR